VQQLVSDLVRAGEHARASDVLSGAVSAGLIDGWEGLSEAQRVARELEGWAWTWDAGDNLRFEWEEPPMSAARAAWREDFYKHWSWNFETGSLRLVRTSLAGGRPEWDALPPFFVAPTTQRPRKAA
jgi:hypothetical protein